MSPIGWIILAVVIVVVVLVALAVWRSQRRKEHAARAEALRHEAQTHAPEIGHHRHEAREAEVKAEAARLEAERAQREATEAQTALAQQEALHEDRLREADRLDPEVDHKAEDYRPTAPETAPETARVDEREAGRGTAAEVDGAPTGGAHRSEERGSDRP